MFSDKKKIWDIILSDKMRANSMLMKLAFSISFPERFISIYLFLYTWQKNVAKLINDDFQQIIENRVAKFYLQLSIGHKMV